jgi:hypothetical protein
MSDYQDVLRCIDRIKRDWDPIKKQLERMEQQSKCFELDTKALRDERTCDFEKELRLNLPIGLYESAWERETRIHNAVFDYVRRTRL